MVQSIFDHGDEEERARAMPASPQYSDTPEALRPDINHSSPAASEPFSQQPDQSQWSEAFDDDTPTVLRREAPPTQLDGTQRVDSYTDPPNVYAPISYGSESEADNVRRSGLAWSAGVVFFGSVAFMLFIGWGADLLFGSSPWGLVLGIVLGSVIGFIQFFRISSQIYEPRSSGPAISPLMSHHDDNDRDQRL